MEWINFVNHPSCLDPEQYATIDFITCLAWFLKYHRILQILLSTMIVSNDMQFTSICDPLWHSTDRFHLLPTHRLLPAKESPHRIILRVSASCIKYRLHHYTTKTIHLLRILRKPYYLSCHRSIGIYLERTHICFVRAFVSL